MSDSTPLPLGDSDCMFCMAPRPVSHQLVRDERGVSIGRVCASHTLRELVMAQCFLIRIEYVPEEPVHAEDQAKVEG